MSGKIYWYCKKTTEDIDCFVLRSVVELQDRENYKTQEFWRLRKINVNAIKYESQHHTYQCKIGENEINSSKKR